MNEDGKTNWPHWRLVYDISKMAAVIVFFAAMVWSRYQTLPTDLEKKAEKLNGHERRLTIMETKLDAIVEDVREIKRILLRRERRP